MSLFPASLPLAAVAFSTLLVPVRVSAEDVKTAVDDLAPIESPDATADEPTKPQGEPVEPEEVVPPERIAELIEELDADEFAVRDRATKALIAAGEPALPALAETLAGEISAERRQRAERIQQAIEFQVISKNPVKLQAIIDLARAPADETAAAEAKRHTALEATLEQLLRVSGKVADQEIAMPVRFADVKPAPAGTFARNQIVRVGPGQNMSSAQNSIVFLENGGRISSVQNSIVIAPYGANVSSCRKSIVIARYELSVSHPQDSVLFSGNRMNLSIAQNCVCGAGGALSISIPKQVTIVNSTYDAQRLRNGGRVVRTPGLVLDLEMENALADDITLTAATTIQGGFALYNHADEGEFVARVNEPLKDTTGVPFENLAGWQLRYVSSSLAIFEKDGEHAVFDVPKR